MHTLQDFFVKRIYSSAFSIISTNLKYYKSLYQIILRGKETRGKVQILNQIHVCRYPAALYTQSTGTLNLRVWKTIWYGGMKVNVSTPRSFVLRRLDEIWVTINECKWNKRVLYAVCQNTLVSYKFSCKVIYITF